MGDKDIMNYNENNLNIDSDFPIRITKQNSEEIDLIILIGNRCLNLEQDKNISFIKSRIQFPQIKSILIRICTAKDNNVATLHFLQDSSLHSSIVNFEIDYLDKIIIVKEKEKFVQMKIK